MGTVIFSFRAGVKDSDNNVRLGEILPGPVRSMIGARVDEIESLTKEHKLKGNGEFANVSAEISVWRDLLIAEEAEVLYQYSDQFYDQYAAVTRNYFGKGTVFYIGGGLNKEPLEIMAKSIVESNNIQYVQSPDQVEVYQREIDDETYEFVMNHSDELKSYQGEELKAFESKIIKK
ncbi:beta-galactosidase trimerization domain-containing protein [Halobacillus seohaensis]|uniref:Beta-galactosidase trimerization domain-containing protein n=1 Tax=Halobacillus seohaensis TaxID=447421 RepID=A0ABW2EIC1_9BACI